MVLLFGLLWKGNSVLNITRNLGFPIAQQVKPWPAEQVEAEIISTVNP